MGSAPVRNVSQRDTERAPTDGAGSSCSRTATGSEAPGCFAPNAPLLRDGTGHPSAAEIAAVAGDGRPCPKRPNRRTDAGTEPHAVARYRYLAIVLLTMKRVVVLGRGAAGKSTASVRLGQITGLAVIELDQGLRGAQVQLHVDIRQSVGRRRSRRRNRQWERGRLRLMSSAMLRACSSQSTYSSFRSIPCSAELRRTAVQRDHAEDHAEPERGFLATPAAIADA